MDDIPTLVRTPAELRAARTALGLSTEALARMVLVDDGSSVRRWEAGTHAIPGPVSVILETAMDFLRQRNSFSEQLENLQSGTMLAGPIGWGSHKDDATGQSIERVSQARKSLDDALAILTRQPPSSGASPNSVHWYNLKRLTPRYKPGQKDEWSLPGETSPERALAYFERDADFSDRLALCDDTDLSAEFLLEQRDVLRTPFGSSQRLQAGDLVQRFIVRRAQPFTKMTTGRTKAEFRGANGQTVCFGTLPPAKMLGSGDTADFNGLKVKFRPDDHATPDKLGRRLASRILFLESDVELVKKMPGFRDYN